MCLMKNSIDLFMGMNGIKYISLLFWVAMVSCGRNTKSAERDATLQYAPLINEVEAVELKKGEFQWQLLANGKLSAASKSKLAFRSEGVITQMNVCNGQRVAEGEVIATLDLREKELDVETERINYEKAELDLYDIIVGQGYPADTTKVPRDFLSVASLRSGFVAARNAYHKAQYDYEGAVLKAPYKGLVADIAYGNFDMTGSEPFCTLIDDSIFNVDFKILESEYPNVSVGMNVRVIPFGSLQNEAVGRIVSVNPVVDKNGQMLVRAQLVNIGGFVDGMNVRVIAEKSIRDKFVVPKSAVVIRDKMQVLFKYVDGRARWTYVNTVMSNSETYCIEPNSDRGASLSEGDLVIVSGNLNIADNSEVVLKGE